MPLITLHSQPHLSPHPPESGILWASALSGQARLDVIAALAWGMSVVLLLWVVPVWHMVLWMRAGGLCSLGVRATLV